MGSNRLGATSRAVVRSILAIAIAFELFQRLLEGGQAFAIRWTTSRATTKRSV